MARPQLRLLFDENLSPRIARALEALGYNSQAVHHVPELGPAATDEAILEHARGRNQTVVTVNLDMVLLCIEADEPVIWVDPKRKKSLTYEEMVVRFFQGVPVWEGLLRPDVVIHARKTSDEVLDFDAARKRVLRRIAKQRAQQAKKKVRHQVEGQAELIE